MNKKKNYKDRKRGKKMVGERRRYRRVWIKGHYQPYRDMFGRWKKKWVPGYWRIVSL